MSGLDFRSQSRIRHLPAWFTGWYMGRVAGHYCPCEWRVKSRRLIDLCGWIDDEEARHSLIREAAFYMQNQRATVHSTGIASITSTRIRFFRKRHNGSQAEQ